MPLLCVYPSDCTDFSTNGLGVVSPQSCMVTETLNGEWELTLVHPIDDLGKWQRLSEGHIIRAPVPAGMTPKVRMTVKGEDTRRDIYAVDTDKPEASVRKGTLRLRTGPGNAYKVLKQYPNGTQVQLLGKTNASWYEVAAPDGKRGYMSTTFLRYVRTEGSLTEAVHSVAEPRLLRDQPFRIYRVVPDLEKITVYARHISYDLLDNMIKKIEPSASAVGASVVQSLSATCLTKHDFTFYSDLTSTAEEVCLENMNPVEALLGEGGLAEKYKGELARDWFDVYLVQRVGSDTDVQIRQGKNLLGISYDVDLTNVTTRIMPTGEDKDGNVLYLPELFIDSPHVDAYHQPKWIHLPVSEAKEVTDGDDKKSKAQCYDAMRKAAQDAFEQGCDLPDVTLTVDFINLAETEEYRQYAFLQNIYMGDAVRVIAPRIGVAVSLRLTHYTYDCLTRKYTDMTLGTVADTVEDSTISSRQLPNGVISGGKLALNSVGTGALQSGSVGSLQIKMAAIETAHIQDAAITQAQIADAAIHTAHIDDAAITTAKIADLAVDEAKIGGLAVTEAKIAEAAISSAKIKEAAIRNAHIEDAAIDTAKIADAAIDTAKIKDMSVTSGKIAHAAIGTAQIGDAVITAAKIGDGEITRAKIADLAVDSAKIEDLAVTTAKIAQAAITNAQIANAAIDTAKIALGAITSALIQQGAIGTAQIADGSITDAKIVDLSANRITTGTLSVERLIIRGGEQSLIYAINNMGELVSTSVDTLDGGVLTERTITADKMVAHSITAAEIAAKTITANEILAGTITGSEIAANAIAASHIQAGSITTSHVTADFGEKLTLTSNKGIQLIVKATEDAQQTANKAQETAEKAVIATDILYAASPSQTVPPADGWSLTAPERADGIYLWQFTRTAYGDGTKADSKPVCLAGADGRDGESAVTVRIDSTRGTVFKGNTGNTLLMAVVYHGSKRIENVEMLREAFGPSAHLEWSQLHMGEEAFSAISPQDPRMENNGFSLRISASEVDGKAVFQCELKD